MLKELKTLIFTVLILKVKRMIVFSEKILIKNNLLKKIYTNNSSIDNNNLLYLTDKILPFMGHNFMNMLKTQKYPIKIVFHTNNPLNLCYIIQLIHHISLHIDQKMPFNSNTSMNS